MVMETCRECRIYNSEDEFFENTSDVNVLATKLNAICQTRKVSKCAVAAAAHMEPFAYNDRMIAYACMKCGMYVKGIEFFFDGNGCVRRVSPFILTL
jgi:hypothetical protein